MPLDQPPARSDLERRLRREMKGDVLFGAFDRGRYATDASIYQIEPIGVVVPKDAEDARIAIQIALKGRTISADAVVLYSHRFGEGPFGEPGMGLKFARIAPQDQEYLRLFIRSEFPV